MTFTLPKLPWAETALAPRISAETIQYHYGKHHQAYVNKLNELTKGTPWEKKSLIDIVKTGEGVMFNQAAQVWNHSFYWNSLSPTGGKEPTGPLKERINRDFGSFPAFKSEFTNAAAGHFGSGWAWLCFDKDQDKLKITQTHDAGNPIRTGDGFPLLTCDVWEHAYYIDYRNARPQYIAAWWELINWDFGNANLEKAQRGEIPCMEDRKSTL